MVPDPVVAMVLNIKTRVLLRYYSLRFGSTLVRKGTTDIKVFKDVFVYGGMDLPEPMDPRVIVDAGAYTGLTSLYYSLHYPQARIISIEPEASNFKKLQENIRSRTNITAVHAGLWHKDAYLSIRDRKTGNWGFAVDEVQGSDAFDIRAITLDHLISAHAIERIGLLKIDIEGAERELFSSNYGNWLKKVDVIVVELHDRFKPGCTDALKAMIDPHEWDEHVKGEKVIMRRKV